jgi:suppressor for copper-sensitivity B
MTAPKTLLLLAAALCGVAAPSPARGAASAWSTNPQSSVRLISPWQTAKPGGELILGLQFRLSPGWHVYWKNSGDAGYPPSVTFRPADVLGTPEILWPTPRRFDLPGGLVAFGYEGEVVYPIRAELKAAAAPPAGETSGGTTDGTSDQPAGGEVVHIAADLDYLVCQVECVPYRYTLTLDQPLGEPATADPEGVALLQAWLERLPRIVREVPGAQTGAVLDASRGGIPELEVRVLGARAALGNTDLFLESQDTFDVGRPRLRATADGVVFHVPMTPKAANKPLPERISFAWTVSGLTAKDGKPFSLEARRDVQVWTDASSKPPDPLQAAVRTPDPFPRLLLRAFLGGALLNLAPAVLALLLGVILALRGSSIGSNTGGGTGVREAAAAAVTGVVGACWVAAGLALLARRAGWGGGSWQAQLQEPVVGALAVVAAALLALNLWGLLEYPLAPPVADAAARPGTGRLLVAGLFTVPLALAWPLPLLQQPLGAAFARGPAAVCAAFAVAGFGFAVPYLLLALLPAAARALPVPGPWLPRLREGLGFLAGGGALWLLHDLSRGVSPEGLASVELALLGLGLLAWLHSRPGTRAATRLALGLALVLCAAGALWLADHNRLSPRSTGPSGSAATAEATPPLRLPPATRQPGTQPTSGG